MKPATIISRIVVTLMYTLLVCSLAIGLHQEWKRGWPSFQGMKDKRWYERSYIINFLSNHDVLQRFGVWHVEQLRRKK